MPPLEKKQCYSAARPAHATRPPPKTPTMRPPPHHRGDQDHRPEMDHRQRPWLQGSVSWRQWCPRWWLRGIREEPQPPRLTEGDEAGATPGIQDDVVDQGPQGRADMSLELNNFLTNVPLKKLWNKTWQMVSETVRLTTWCRALMFELQRPAKVTIE